MSLPAAATTINYQLSNATILNGGTVTGAFAYDTAVGAVTGGSFTTTTNSSGLYATTYNNFQAVINYSPGPQVIFNNGHGAGLVFLANGGFQLGATGTFNLEHGGAYGS